VVHIEGGLGKFRIEPDALSFRLCFLNVQLRSLRLRTKHTVLTLASHLRRTS
jgi:hypothetical protein